MDNSEALALLEEMDTIRVKAGLTRMDENSRRDFLKKMGAGAVAAGAAAAGISPGTAQAGEHTDSTIDTIRKKIKHIKRYAALMNQSALDAGGKEIDNNLDYYNSITPEGAIKMIRIANSSHARTTKNIVEMADNLEEWLDLLIKE